MDPVLLEGGILRCEDGHEFFLTKTQDAILKILLNNPGRWHTDEAISNLLKDGRLDRRYPSADVQVKWHITNIRKLLGDKSKIVTRIDWGYSWNDKYQNGVR